MIRSVPKWMAPMNVLTIPISSILAIFIEAMPTRDTTAIPTCCGSEYEAPELTVRAALMSPDTVADPSEVTIIPPNRLHHPQV